MSEIQQAVERVLDVPDVAATRPAAPCAPWIMAILLRHVSMGTRAPKSVTMSNFFGSGA